MALPPSDLNELARAKFVLENPGFAIRLADRAGKPIDALVRRLPEPAQKAINDATRKALESALEVAVGSLDQQQARPSDDLHRAVALLSGAFGGLAGLPGFFLELPFSVTVMLRSIADHARAQGEDLSMIDTRLECLTVFAYGSRSGADDAADSAYFATRAAFAQAVSHAAEWVTQRGVTGALSERAAPAVVQLLARIGQRLGLTVTEKAAAQLVPFFGAVGGATINALFLDHYQTTAKAHFTVRRLERAHGFEEIRRSYVEVAEDPAGWTRA